MARVHLMKKDRLAAQLEWRKATDAGLRPETFDPLELPIYEGLRRQLGRD
jgi:hypothetical protein